MAGYVYPPAQPTLSGDVETINRFLQSPTLVARRLRTLLEQRYIADHLLSQKFQVSGGAILYETGETIYSDDAPLAIAPGGEYPMTTVSTGAASLASVVKWGQDTYVTDESIKRRLMNPVERALLKLANENVRYVDSIALSAIASAVTATAAATASWATATAAQILQDVALAKANIVKLNQGYSPDTVVVDDINLAYALSRFSSAGYFARENNSDNPIVSGDFFRIIGLNWLASPNIPTSGVAVVLDSSMLGGMADEALGGPGYASAGPSGVETKVLRDDDDDQWRLRCRRVTVPVVIEPAAGRKITGL